LSFEVSLPASLFISNGLGNDSLMGIGGLIMLGINAATHDDDVCAAVVDDLEGGAIRLAERIGGDVEGDAG